MAIHAVRRMPTPVLLRIDVVGVGSIMIDPRQEGYAGVAADVLPVHPSAVRVETHPAEALPTADEAPHDLDAALWFIGANAFDTARASWLWPGDRYRLTRWPRVTRLDIDIEMLKMFAALGTTMISVEELAEAAEVPVAQAQRAINALSLMGLLESSSAAPPPAPPRASRRPEAHGLFGRLRRSLGF